MFSTVRRRPGLLLLPPLLAAAAACGGPEPLEVRVPSPEGETAEACRALQEALPDEVEGLDRRELAEPTPFAAAWGDGDDPLVLRCGMGRPEVLDPGSAAYQPSADAVMVDDVSWLVESEGDGHRFTTTERTVWVEIVLPGSLEADAGVLVDFAAPVDGAIPLDPLWEEFYADDAAGGQHPGGPPPEDPAREDGGPGEGPEDGGGQGPEHGAH